MHWQLLPVPGRRAAQLAPPAARRQVVIVVANDGEPQGYVRRTLELPGGCQQNFCSDNRTTFQEGLHPRSSHTPSHSRQFR